MLECYCCEHNGTSMGSKLNIPVKDWSKPMLRVSGAVLLLLDQVESVVIADRVITTITLGTLVAFTVNSCVLWGDLFWGEQKKKGGGEVGWISLHGHKVKSIPLKLSGPCSQFSGMKPFVLMIHWCLTDYTQPDSGAHPLSWQICLDSYDSCWSQPKNNQAWELESVLMSGSWREMDHCLMVTSSFVPNESVITCWRWARCLKMNISQSTRWR